MPVDDRGSDTSREEYLRKTVATEIVALALWLPPVYWGSVAVITGGPVDWPLWKMAAAPVMFALAMVLHIPVHKRFVTGEDIKHCIDVPEVDDEWDQ